MASEEIEGGVASVGLGDDVAAKIGVQATNWNQGSFFRAVQEGNVKSIESFLKNRKDVDVNAYNSEGATPLLLAVYKYEVGRDLEVVKTLLKYGADVGIKAAPPPSAHKISIVRQDDKHHGAHLLSTKKISFDHKTALLVALELKSSLYLKGWEYRHWDALIHILADATVAHFAAKELNPPSVNPHSAVAAVEHNWDAVFRSGKHELVELVAEGKEIMALKLLVTGSSKILKLNLVEANRVEIHDASYNLAKALVHFLYVGKVETSFIEQRGIDLFCCAHKYGVYSLQHLLEASIVPTQDNWIKLLTAAVESDSNVLTLKTAQSITEAMERREGVHGVLKKSFSEVDSVPTQLYQSTSNLS